MLNYILKSIETTIDNEIKIKKQRERFLKIIDKKIESSKLKKSIQRNKLIQYLLELELYEYSQEYFEFENIFKEMKILFPKYTKQNFQKNIQHLIASKVLLCINRRINNQQITIIKLNLNTFN